MDVVNCLKFDNSGAWRPSSTWCFSHTYGVMPRSVSPIPDNEVLSGRKWAQQVLDPWGSLILTLDGGGIRGYSSLLILKRLMHEIAVWEEKLDKEQGSSSEPGRFKEQELLPCHYFDYMYGTSTGG